MRPIYIFKCIKCKFENIFYEPQLKFICKNCKTVNDLYPNRKRRNILDNIDNSWYTNQVIYGDNNVWTNIKQQ